MMSFKAGMGKHFPFCIPIVRMYFFIFVLFNISFRLNFSVMYLCSHNRFFPLFFQLLVN